MAQYSLYEVIKIKETNKKTRILNRACRCNRIWGKKTSECCDISYDTGKSNLLLKVYQDNREKTL